MAVTPTPRPTPTPTSTRPTPTPSPSPTKAPTKAPDIYDLLVKQGIYTQAQADAARAAANKPATTTSSTAAATPKPTSNKYPTIFSSTAADAFINKTFQSQLKRDATAAELKYWKPLLKAAQTAGGASQKYAVKDKVGIQTTLTGLDEEQWLKDQLATNVEYKKTLKDVDYATEINTIKVTDPKYYARQEEKKVYNDAVKAAAGDPAKIAALNDTTTYGRGLKELLSNIQIQATNAGATNTPEELNALAQKLYDKGILAGSAEAVAEIDNAFKSTTGLVKDQADAITKLTANKKIYDKLIADAKGDPTKIAAANDTTEYGRGLKEITAALQAKAKDNGAINTPEELTTLAKKLYDKGLTLASEEGAAAVDIVLKTKNGLVSDQPADLIKLAADKKIYDKLITAAAGDPTAIAKAKTTTAYGRGLSEIEAALKSQAKISGASNTAEELTALAQSLYDTGVKPGSNEGIAKINEAFKYNADAKTGRYSGTAGTTIADLQKTASDNGLDLQKNFGDQISGWLTAIASGEDVKNIKQQIREVAKLGQPDSIKKLIDNGTDLKTIYAPYRNTMASVLEIQDPNSIRLDDPSLRMAITPAGELNLYDYQKTLRKDDRWQYTQQANSEVARATKQVLQDFGFMG
jgi:hypothetical protein